MDPDFDQRSTLSLAVAVLQRHPRERKLLRFGMLLILEIKPLWLWSFQFLTEYNCRHASALIYYLLESTKVGLHQVNLVSDEDQHLTCPSCWMSQSRTLQIDGCFQGFTRVVKQRLLSTLLGVMRQYQVSRSVTVTFICGVDFVLLNILSKLVYHRKTESWCGTGVWCFGGIEYQFVMPCSSSHCTKSIHLDRIEQNYKQSIDVMKSLMVDQCSLTGKLFCIPPIVSSGAVFPLSRVKCAGFLFGADTQYSILTQQLAFSDRFMTLQLHVATKLTRIKFTRFDDRESGRHEDLLLQYPRVVDILLFVVERFRLEKKHDIVDAYDILGTGT